ncbi:hypothetical protein PACTADRAFT_48921 [Pachysolen tannophilus NRRL Y-2460]|uniref:Serine aminopeptidase S33 domain-containing protein n=1 Tax=Pachysolen tannophilus NRRL Y-2460 TaxID=669874 RepID=A0A1E4TZL0_PACTA|nr:hypothetical protein PACTADRAFT_48921 [Pachysolen tannophilus NRRL Y-2460]
MSQKYVVTDIDPKSTSVYEFDKLSYPYKAKNSPLHRKIKFSNSEVEFYTVFWPIPKDVKFKARFLVVHGFCERAKVYDRLLDQLSCNGYECLFFDQRGAGLTSPGKLKGLTNDHYSYKDLDNFIDYSYDQLLEEKKPLNLYLLGHSMGGGLVLSYLAFGKHLDKVKGVVSAAPLILLHPKSKPSLIIEKMVTFVCWFKTDIKFNTNLAAEFVSSNQDYLDFCIADSMEDPVGTIGQLKDMIFRGRDLLENNAISKIKNHDKPILILFGEDDKINLMDGGIQFIDKINDKIPNENRKIVTFPNARHNLFLETDDIFSATLNQILQFMDKQLDSL